MADPLGSVEKIVKLAGLIKHALETVRRNKEECRGISKQVARISAILGHLKAASPEVMVSQPAMSGPLEDLADTLDRALALVRSCQERHAVSRFFTAGDTARQLRWVREDMAEKMMAAVLANTVHITLVLRDIKSSLPSTTEITISQFEAPKMSSNVSSYCGGEGPLLATASGNTVILFEIESSCGGEGRPFTQPASAHRRYNLCRLLFTCFSDLSDLVHDLLRHGCIDREESAISLSPVESSYACHHTEYRTETTGDNGFTKFSLSELEIATHNFSEDNIIGQGSFATVYKGVLHDGLVVAIKKIQYPYQLSMEHICDKFRHVSKLEHKNIVQLLGYGYAIDYEGYVFLVEENIPHGSMDHIIYGSQFNWSSRLRVIQGIANGVHYLHQEHFVHLDLKPSNILVDFDINPKITDFGRAKMLDQGDDVTTHDIDDYLLAGTMGYMPPEYIIEDIVSTMYDVYSFGVILLETISGMCTSEPARHQASIEWAWAAREVGRMEELLDPSLCSESQLKEVRRCMEIGLLCTQSDLADRPHMLDVVDILDNKKELPTPKQPNYTKVPRNSDSMVQE